MSNSTNPIVVDPATLSRAISNVLKNAKTGNFDKNTALNELAREIAGGKHNWGYLTSAKGPIFAPHMRNMYELKRAECITRIDKDYKPAVSFESLGYSAAQCQALERIRKRSFGLVVAGGPNGSGRATLIENMAARTNEMSNREINTLLINQANLPAHTVEYHSAITKALRNDPDIIALLDAVESPAEMGLAMATAMTGHQVYASLPAYDAFDTLERMRCDLGVEDYKLSDPTLVTGLIGQRLLPRLCDKCKVPLNPRQPDHEHIFEAMRSLGLKENDLSLVAVRNGQNHSCCKRGRSRKVLVAEVVETNRELMQDLQTHGHRGNYVRQNWKVTSGQLSMDEHGFSKVLAGLICPRDYQKEFGSISNIQTRRIPKILQVAEEYR